MTLEVQSLESLDEDEVDRPNNVCLPDVDLCNERYSVNPCCCGTRKTVSHTEREKSLVLREQALHQRYIEEVNNIMSTPSRAAATSSLVRKVSCGRFCLKCGGCAAIFTGVITELRVWRRH